jgi:hypothetical protein
MLTAKQRERRRAGAKLRMASAQLLKFNVEECLVITRRDNNKVFEAAMDLRFISERVFRGDDFNDLRQHTLRMIRNNQ